MANGVDEGMIKRDVLAYWKAGPLNRPVKVTSSDRHPEFWCQGYITCRKFVAGRPLPEVERILGLKAGELARGAYVYELQRLPTPDEFELRGYSQTPGGKNWDPGSAWPAGQGAAQWRIKDQAYIPARVVAAVQPGQVIP